MTDRQRLLEELAHDEGSGPMKNGRHLPYRCPAGKLTIGYGRNIDDHGISSREAFDNLDHDVDDAIADLAGACPWFVTLDPVRQRAVVNLRFNVGGTAFRKFRKFLAAMAARDYATAAAELVDSRWSTQIQPSRRDRIVRQIATGDTK